MSIATLHSTYSILPEAGSYFGASSLKSVSQNPSLKPRFCLFQRVWDQLYLTPPSLEEHTSSSSAYLGALGFTKPLDRIVLHTIPLKSLLEWLSKTKDPNLVETTVGGAHEKALVLAVTKHMLYAAHGAINCSKNTTIEYAWTKSNVI